MPNFVLGIYFVLLLNSNIALTTVLTSTEVSQNPYVDFESIIKGNNNNVPNLTNSGTTLKKCENSELLYPLLNILLEFFQTRNSDINKFMNVLPLIKKYLDESTDSVEKDEINKKLKSIEDQSEWTPNRALRGMYDSNEPFKTNIVFKTVPPNINQPNCKDTLEKLIQDAYNVYLQLAKYPTCLQSSLNPNNIASANPIELNPNDFSFDIKFTNPESVSNRPQDFLNNDNGLYSSHNLKPIIGDSKNSLQYLNNNNPDLITIISNIASLLQHYRPGQFSLVETKGFPSNGEMPQLYINQTSQPDHNLLLSNLNTGDSNANLKYPHVPFNIMQYFIPEFIKKPDNPQFKLDATNYTNPQANNLYFNYENSDNALADLVKNYLNLPINHKSDKIDFKEKLEEKPQEYLGLPENRFKIPSQIILNNINKNLPQNPFLEQIIKLLKNQTNNHLVKTPQNAISNADNPDIKQEEIFLPNNKAIFSMQDNSKPSQTNILPHQQDMLNPYSNFVNVDYNKYPNLKNPYSNSIPYNENNVIYTHSNSNGGALPNQSNPNLEHVLNIPKELASKKQQTLSKDSNQPSIPIVNQQQNSFPSSILYPGNMNFIQNKYPHLLSDYNLVQLNASNQIFENPKVFPDMNKSILQTVPNYMKYKSVHSNSVMPNSITGTPSNYAPIAGNSMLLPDLQRLAITNLYKLNTLPDLAGMIELTYFLKRPKQLLYQPYYFVKYRLPYQTFVHNLHQLLLRKPFLRSNPIKLYQELVTMSNITEISPDLKGVGEEDIQKLISDNGALVKAKIINGNDAFSNKQLKVIQNLNAAIRPEEILKINQEQMNLGVDKNKVGDNTKVNKDVHNFRLENVTQEAIGA
ncbi:uncharacterized protein LOC113522392 [Galleria mellonella]|uniref:Uncharacterized protein LOC113522392 n=1 Tax=Galleria mellonella TaxID=7137 RepID=A0A6J3BZE0_GALME|nr:uncharacterized protein LOC113522392 [Galleria mellonella]